MTDMGEEAGILDALASLGRRGGGEAGGPGGGALHLTLSEMFTDHTAP